MTVIPMTADTLAETRQACHHPLKPLHEEMHSHKKAATLPHISTDRKKGGLLAQGQRICPTDTHPTANHRELESTQLGAEGQQVS